MQERRYLDAENCSVAGALDWATQQQRRFHPQREPLMNLEVVPHAKPGSKQPFLGDIRAIRHAVLWRREVDVRCKRLASHSERWAHVQSSVEMDLRPQEQEVGFQDLRSSRWRKSTGGPVGHRRLLVTQPVPLIVQHDHDSRAAVPCPRTEGKSAVSLHFRPIGADLGSACTYTDEAMSLRQGLARELGS